jgi:hypothetical protein
MKFKFLMMVALLMGKGVLGSELLNEENIPIAEIIDVSGVPDGELIEKAFDGIELRSFSSVNRCVKNKLMANTEESMILVKFRNIDHLRSIAQEFSLLQGGEIVFVYDPNASLEAEEDIVESTGEKLIKDTFFDLTSQMEIKALGDLKKRSWEFKWPGHEKNHLVVNSKVGKLESIDLDQRITLFSTMRPLINPTSSLEVLLEQRQEDRLANPQKYKTFDDIIFSNTFIFGHGLEIGVFDSIETDGNRIIFAQDFDDLRELKKQTAHSKIEGKSISIIGLEDLRGVYHDQEVSLHEGFSIRAEEGDLIVCGDIGNEENHDFDLKVYSKKDMWVTSGRRYAKRFHSLY